MKECNVLTTASRTFGMVCRKNGNSVGAKVESGSLSTNEYVLAEGCAVSPLTIMIQ